MSANPCCWERVRSFAARSGEHLGDMVHILVGLILLDVVARLLLAQTTPKVDSFDSPITLPLESPKRTLPRRDGIVGHDDTGKKQSHEVLLHVCTIAAKSSVQCREL